VANKGREKLQELSKEKESLFSEVKELKSNLETAKEKKEAADGKIRGYEEHRAQAHMSQIDSRYLN
jgi:predicted nuclease with TOPRIM domain